MGLSIPFVNMVYVYYRVYTSHHTIIFSLSGSLKNILCRSIIRITVFYRTNSSSTIILYTLSAARVIHLHYLFCFRSTFTKQLRQL